MRNLLKAVAWLCFLPLVSVNASITNQTDKQGPVIVGSGFPGVSSQFIVSFPFQQASDLLVLDYGNPSGVLRDPAAILVLGSDYTVSSGGYNAANQMTNGVVTMQTGVNNVLANDYLVIMRNVPLNQITSFTATGPLTITQIEQSLDKMATLSQQVNEVATGRALQFENFEVTGQNSLNAGANVLPLTARKSTLLGFDTNGNPAFYPLATSGSAGIVTGASTSQLVVQANSFAAGTPVTFNGSTWVAATANSTQLASNALGVVSSNGLSGTQFVVVNSGVCPVAGGTFTPGAIYYVPLSSGVVTSTAPSGAGQYVYAVATAESATVLVVGISTPSQVVAFPTLSGNNTWTGTNAFNNLVGIGGATAAGVGLNQTWTSASGDFVHMSNTNVAATRSWAFGPGTGGAHTFGFYDTTGGTDVLSLGDGAYGTPYQITMPASGGLSVTGPLATSSTLTVSGSGAVNLGSGTTTSSGSINGPIGSVTPATGNFTILNATASASTTPFTVNGGGLTAGTFASNVIYNASGLSIATSGTTDTTSGVRWQVGSVTLDLGAYASGSTYLQNRALANYGTWYPILINPAGGNVILGGSSSTVTVTNALSVGGTSTLTGTVTQTAKTTTYNNIATAGEGVPAIYSAPAISATKTANFTVLTYTPPASAGLYRIYGVITTTSATNTGTVQFTVDYKDSQGTVHTADVLPLTGAAGTIATTQSGASKEYEMVPRMISVDNSATSIVVKVVITGSVSYTTAATVEQLQ